MATKYKPLQACEECGGLLTVNPAHECPAVPDVINDGLDRMYKPKRGWSKDGKPIECNGTHAVEWTYNMKTQDEILYGLHQDVDRLAFRQKMLGGAVLLGAIVLLIIVF